MSQGEVISLAQQALYVTILISLPAMGIGLLVGLIVSIFQATTQINEQTLAFVPKIIAIFVILVVAGPWMMNVLIDFTTRLFGQINTIIQ